MTASGPALWRNVGTAWVDATARALPAALTSADDAPVAMAMGDLDGDGDTDAVVRLASGRVRVWRNDGGSARASLRVRLAARVSNRSAIGSKVELRAGSLLHKIETSSATPAVGPSDVLFGLGPRDRADVVRVLWPAGILQAETDLPAPAPPSSAAVVSIDRTGPQAFLLPVSLHLERHAVRVRDRLHGRRRDGGVGRDRARRMCPTPTST